MQIDGLFSLLSRMYMRYVEELRLTTNGRKMKQLLVEWSTVGEKKIVEKHF